MKESRTAVMFCWAKERVVEKGTEVVLGVVVVGNARVPLCSFDLHFSNK